MINSIQFIFEFNIYAHQQIRRPSLLYIECKSRDLSRRNSRISQNDTMNKENSNYLSIQLPISAKKIDRTMGSNLGLNVPLRIGINAYRGSEWKIIIKSRINWISGGIGRIDRISQNSKQISQNHRFNNQKYNHHLNLQIRDREIKHKQLKERIHQETNQAMQQYIKQWGKVLLQDTNL